MSQTSMWIGYLAINYELKSNLEKLDDGGSLDTDIEKDILEAVI